MDGISAIHYSNDSIEKYVVKMGILDRTLVAKGLVAPEVFRKQHLRTSDVVNTGRGDLNSIASKRDIAKLYQEHSQVYRSVDRIGSDIAGLKVKIIKILSDGTRENVTDDPKFRTITKRANEWQTAFDLWESTFSNLVLFGESYWEIIRGKNNLIAKFYPVAAKSITPIPDPDGFIKGYTFKDERGNEKTIPAKDIIYIKTFNPNDDFKGQGSVQPAWQELVLNLNALAYSRKWFENSSLPLGVIETDVGLEDADIRRMSSIWDEIHRGIDNSSRIGILDAGAKFKQIGLSQQDMQFMEQLQSSTDVIISTIGPTPAVVGRFAQAIRANAEVQEESYWTHTIKPLTRRLESFMETILIPFMNTPEADIEMFFETEFEVSFDFSSVQLMQRRAMEKIEVLIRASDRAAVSPNEIRRQLRKVFPDETFDDIAIGGDVTSLLQNLTPAGFTNITGLSKSIHRVPFGLLGKQIDEEDANIIGGFNVNSPEVNQFTLTSQANRAAIDTHSKELLIAAFRDSFAAGEDIGALTQRLLGTFEDFDQVRAARIARTETLGTLNFSTLEGYRQSGLDIRKSWLTVRDGSVRGSSPKDNGNHVALEGETVEVKAAFSNGLKFPGDQSTGAAEEVVNCRCTLAPASGTGRKSKQKKSEDFKDFIYKQFDIRLEMFESRMTTGLQVLFNKQKMLVMTRVAELDLLVITEGDAFKIIDEAIKIGEVNTIIQPFTDELLVVAGNEGIIQAGRV